MRKSRIPVLAVLLILLLGLAFPAGPARADSQPLIQDDADLLSGEEEALLREDMLPLCEYGTPLFWSTWEEGDYETLADRFYHQHLGRGESGALFVINLRARQLTVFTDGEMHRVITRGEAETITDNVYRLAGREEYYACARSAFDQMGRLMRGERIARPMKLAGNVFLALVLALLGVYLYLRFRYETSPSEGKKGAALPVTAAGAAAFALTTANAHARMTKQTKTNVSSSSGHGGGGGFSGGGGGGGSSGGGGSHGF